MLGSFGSRIVEVFVDIASFKSFLILHAFSTYSLMFLSSSPFSHIIAAVGFSVRSGYIWLNSSRTFLPYELWNEVKEYAGIYNTPININEIGGLQVDRIYGLYRNWFGRFTLPDYYDTWNLDKQRRWLLKNLVLPTSYKLNQERYIQLSLMTFD